MSNATIKSAVYRALTNTDISLQQRVVLALIGLHPEGWQVSTRELADLIGTAQPNVVHVIQNLIKEGLIERQLGARKIDPSTLTLADKAVKR